MVSPFGSPLPRPRPAVKLLLAACAVVVCLLLSPEALRVRAQQTNPVDRQVNNPMTDTPNINPLSQTQPVVRPRRPPTQNGAAPTPAPTPGQPTDLLDIDSERQTFSGPEDARVFVYEGNVDERSGDKIVVRNAVITACDEENPKWSFTTKRATITMNDRVRAKNPFFRVKGVPLLYMPYA
jgi:hypothetical protein